MKMNGDAPREISDLPVFSKRADGVNDYDHVEAQRALGPIARDSAGMLHLFSQADLFTVLDDALTRQIETETLLMRGVTDGPAWEFHAHSLLFSNGDAHRARRGALGRTFAFPLMRALRPEIRATVEALVAEAGRTGRPVDFLRDVAGPLPARVIASILGVPQGDAEAFAQLVYSAIRVMQLRSDDVFQAASADLERLNAYVAMLMEDRRRNPDDDFLTRFVKDADATGRLDETEVRTQIVTVIFGGSDTTRASLTMAFARLLQHPEQWEMIKADPDGWKAAAVEEALRFDPVVGGLGRVAVRDFDLRGLRIPKHTAMSPNLVGALRDPDMYRNPQSFDITRTDHPRHTPAFGAGPHRCLGEALARVELEEALATLARAWPDAALVGDPPRMRGLSGTRTVSECRVDPKGR